MRIGLGIALALVCSARGAAAVEAAAKPVATAVAVSAAPVATPPGPAPGRAPGVSQSVRGDNVLIEGKLYSPQALFIVTRHTERFGRDAIVPTYLDVRPDAAFLPYRLRADRLGAPAAASADSGATAPGTAR